MLKLFLSLLLLAVVTYGIENCNQSQKTVMKKQWANAFKVQKSRNGSLGEIIWLRMYDAEPNFEIFFKILTEKERNTTAFRSFTRKVMTAFDTCIAVLDDDDILNAQLNHLKGIHKGKFILPKYYDLLLHTMMDVVSEINESPVDGQIWRDCGGYIMAGMQSHDEREDL